MSFKEDLLEQGEKSDLNFEGLVQMIENCEIPCYNAVLKGNINGMATLDGIYVNFFELVHRFDKDKLFFIILHEMAHFKRNSVYSKQEYVDMMSTHDSISYTNFVITEEIIADRYGAFVFYLLNKKVFPKDRTQQLDKESKRFIYSKRLSGTYDYIKDQIKTVEDYDTVLNQFVTHVR